MATVSAAADSPSRLEKLEGESRPKAQRARTPIAGLDVANGWLTLAWRQEVPNGHWRGRRPVLAGVRAVPIPADMDWTHPACAELVRTELHRLSSLPPLFATAVADTPAPLWLRLDEKNDETCQYLIPKTSADDRDTVALCTAHRAKLFDEANSLFDYRVGTSTFARGLVRVPVTALIAAKATVAALREQVESAGLTPTGITSTLVSLRNLYTSGWLACPWERFALVEVEERFIRVLLFSKDGRADSSRTIRPGLRTLVSALRTETRDPSDPAAPVSLRANASGSASGQAAEHSFFRCDRSPAEEAELLTRLAPALHRLKQKLDSALPYAVGKTDHPDIQGLVLSAPPCCVSLLQTTFESLGLPCRRLQLDGATTAQGQTDLEHARATVPEAHLTRAIGLCLSTNAGTPNVLMTSPKRRLLAKQTRIARLALVGATVLTLAIGLGSVHAYQDRLALRQEKNALQTQLASWNPVVTLEEVRATLARVERRHAEIHSVEQRRLAAALVSELAARTPDTIQLLGLRVTFPPVQPTAAALPAQRAVNRATARTSAANSALVIINGTVSGDIFQRESRLAEYLNQLGQSPLILSLQIEKQPGEAETMSFVAKLTLVAT